MDEKRVIGGRYRILDILGTGGVGRTYRAFDEKLGRYVAIKKFMPMGLTDEDGKSQLPTISVEKYEKLRRRFLEEARKLARIKHEGIPEVYDILEENGAIYIVMELVKGMNLRELVEKRGKLDLNFALNTFSRICDIVGFMHEKGIIHCDLKPDNVIMDEDGNVKIVDFGSAREYIGEYTQTQPGFFTPGYAPIELYAFKIPKGPFTDVYSLGGILYFMLTGKDPVSAPDRVGGIILPSVRKFNPNVPEHLEKAIFKAMAMDPNERFKKVDELKKAIASDYETENVEYVGVGMDEEKKEKDFEIDMEETVFFSGCLKVIILSILTFIFILFVLRFCSRFILIL